MAMTSPTRIRLATENGCRVGRTPKAKRLAAKPSTDAARLTRSIAKVRQEAERALADAERADALLQKAFGIACGSDKDLTIAMMRHVLVEARMAGHFRGLIRSLEMAEEGALCA